MLTSVIEMNKLNLLGKNSCPLKSIVSMSIPQGQKEKALSVTTIQPLTVAWLMIRTKLAQSRRIDIATWHSEHSEQNKWSHSKEKYPPKKLYRKVSGSKPNEVWQTGTRPSEPLRSILSCRFSTFVPYPSCGCWSAMPTTARLNTEKLVHRMYEDDATRN